MTVPENLRQKCVISEENFFLKTKSFLFSLLCTVHINLAYLNAVPLPSVKYDLFYVSKIQLHVKYMLYKMKSIVTLINPKIGVQTYCKYVNLR